MYKLIWLLVVLFVPAGCGRFSQSTKAVEHSDVALHEKSSDVALYEKRAEDTLICPKFYDVRIHNDNYDRDDFIDENGVQCSDGNYYCYGENAVPEKRPAVSQGYVCQSFEYFPLVYDYRPFKSEFAEISSKQYYENYYENTFYPYCTEPDAVFREVDSPQFAKEQFGWFCMDENCICGGKDCPFGAQCFREQCIPDASHPLDYEDSDNCELWDIISKDTEQAIADNRITEGMTQCGEISFPNDSNMICLPHPDGNLVKFEHCPELTDAEWERIEQNRKTSDETSIDDYTIIPEGLSKPYRMSQKGLYKCVCGDEVCATDTGCYQGHCVDVANHKPLPEGFVWKTGRPYCDKPQCKCQKEDCHKGQWCIEGRCFDHRDVMKVDHHYIEYGMYEFSNPTGINHYFDEEREEALPRDHYVSLDNFAWLDIVTHRNSALCDDPVLPQNLSDYRCVVAALDNGCGEGFLNVYSFNGYHCIKDEGCACGTETCPMHARCYHGKCLYDQIYRAMACNMDYSFTPTDTPMWNGNHDSWCKCGVSNVPPNVDGYICQPSWEDNAGMQCMKKDGCQCGNMTCDYQELCISPGKCASNGVSGDGSTQN